MQKAGKQLLLHAQSPDAGKKAGRGHPVVLLTASARTHSPEGEGEESSSDISLSILAMGSSHCWMLVQDTCHGNVPRRCHWTGVT